MTQFRIASYPTPHRNAPHRSDAIIHTVVEMNAKYSSPVIDNDDDDDDVRYADGGSHHCRCMSTKRQMPLAITKMCEILYFKRLELNMKKREAAADRKKERKTFITLNCSFFPPNKRAACGP